MKQNFCVIFSRKEVNIIIYLVNQSSPASPEKKKIEKKEIEGFVRE
jgi:hypothetical protein